ncbi:MAG: ABC transporter substrate-binding protein [Defluviitaleaceae bacterium]|nr:ABC transporter substrate-binding protein [Defluviitaleaceae bacterium]
MLFRKILIFAILLMALAACGSKSDLDEVTLVLDWTPNTNHTGFYVAMHRGYFAEEGISLRIIQPPEDGAVTLVAAGHAEFGISFQEETLLAANSPYAPLPVVAIAALVEHNTSGVLSLAEHGITRFRDLEGKTFGSWMIPYFDEMIRESVRMDGGNPDLVEFVPHMALDNITGIQREFDAVWVYEGWDRVVAEQMGLDVNYFALRDVNPVFDYYTPVLITSLENVQNERVELTERFLRASARGFEFARDKPTEAARILHQYVPEMSLDLLIASQEFLSENYFSEKWGYIDARRWVMFTEWMHENGFITSDSGNTALVIVDF